MKIRNGFVSNSSSSSFICDITGNVESGMDITLEDCDMYQCVEEHTFCGDYMIEGDKDKLNEDDCRYNVPEKYCPVCNGTAKKIIIKRLQQELKRLNIKKEEL